MVWGAVVAMASAQVIGAIWYSKLLFGRLWLRATFPGKTESQITQMQKESFQSEFVVCVISQVALVLAIHYVIGPYLGVKSVEQGIKVGLGMTLLSTLIDVCHCAFSRRAVSAFLIDHGYNACVFVTSCVAFAHFG